MIWVVLAFAGGIGALLVGMIGFGTSLVVLPTLAILLPTMFAPEIALRLATGTTMATMAVGAVVAGIAQSRGEQVNRAHRSAFGGLDAFQSPAANAPVLQTIGPVFRTDPCSIRRV